MGPKTQKNCGDMWLDLDQESTSRLLKVLGIDILAQVEGYQVIGRMLKVWLKEGISLERFCRQESIVVNKDLRTGMIRPAGRTDVTVSIFGLDFNTPDTFVFDYLNKFGTVMKNEVIYGRYTEGPFKGKFNGDRRYQVDFSQSERAMGTYHIIDGNKVRIFYSGNRKTCGRCHNFSDNCPGGGISKDCENSKGPRVSIIDHMRNLWETINFVPNSFEFNLVEEGSDASERVNDKPIRDTTGFSPKLDRPEPTPNDIARYGGLTVLNFPKKVSDQEIFDFLKEVGGEELTDNTEIKLNRTSKNTSASLDPLKPEVVQKMIKLIHFPETKKKFFGVPLYCRAVRGMTPQKSSNITTDPNQPFPKHGEHDGPAAVKPKKPTLQPDGLTPSLSNAEHDLENVPPIAEIKSKLFGNVHEEESEPSDNDEDNLDKVRAEFLFSDDEFSPANKRGKKKRGRKSSTENSDKKHRNKGTKSAKYIS